MENSWPPQPRIRNLLDVTWRMRMCRTSPNVPNGRVFMPIVYLFWLMQNNVCWLLNVIDLLFQWLAFVGSLFRFSNTQMSHFYTTCCSWLNRINSFWPAQGVSIYYCYQLWMNKFQWITPSKNNNDLVLICFQLPSNIWIYDTKTEKGTKFDDWSSFPLQQLP